MLWRIISILQIFFKIFTYADTSEDEKDELPIHTYSMSSREKRKEIKEVKY